MKRLNKKSSKIILSAIAIGILIISGFLFWNKPEIASATWWDDTWHYRKALIINHNKVSADLVDFPMLVNITDADLGAHAQTDGDDIVFIDADGNQLSHEIENFSTSTGALAAWVKIPTLSSTADEFVYLYYGNASVANQQDGENVWDYNYKLIQHLQETDIDGGTDDITDSSQYANHGKTYNMDTSDQITGKIGGSIDFDGNNDYIEIDDDNSLDLGAGDFTISIWIKMGYGATPSSGYWPGVFVKGLTTSMPAHTWGFLQRTVTTCVTTWSQSNDAGGSSVASLDSDCQGGWRLFTAQRSGSTVNYYIDGAYYSQDTSASTDLNNAYAIRLARGFDDSTAYADTNLDEARVSDIARSATWIATEYNNQNDPAAFLAAQPEETHAGPVGYWSFDEGYGATAHDESGTDNDGTITGAVWQDESMCVSGKCLYFDGNDFVNLGQDESLDFTPNVDEFTFSIWAKTASSSYGSLVGKRDSTEATIQYQMHIDQGGDLSGWSGGTQISYYPDYLNDSKWHNITAVNYDDSGTKKYRLYVDGHPVGDEITSGSATNAYDILIGARRNTGNTGSAFNFYGFIDEAKIYPYARSADEIKQDYNAGLAGQGTSQGTIASFGGSSDKWMTDGLVGYWKMDESAGTYDDDNAFEDAADSSGNGNTGDANGHASTTVGKYGNGGNFDGTDDYISVADSDIWNLDSQFTLSTWIKTSSVSNQEIFSNFSSGSPYPGFGMQLWGGYLKLHVSSDAAAGATQDNSGITFNDGQWHLATIVFDNGNIKFYKNGKILSSQTTGVASAGNPNHALSIGRDCNTAPGRYFNGQIDEVRIYNRALSPGEVSKLYEWAPGPVGHWKMDELTGTTAYDTSGNGNNGTMYNMATSTNGGRDFTGKFGGALNFDGTDDYVAIGDPADGSLDFGTGSFSYGMWVKPTINVGTWDTPWWKGGSSAGEKGYDYELGSGWWNAVLSDGSNTFLNGFINPGPLNSWTHIFSVVDRNTNLFTVYVNGAKQTAGAPVDISTLGSVSTTLGAFVSGQSDHSGPFKGFIDDVRIYNYARTQKQILEDMNNGHPALDSPVLNLSFDEGYGNAAYDSGIGGNDGSLQPGTGGTNTSSSSMWTKDGKIGGAMEFDGTDDHISVLDSDNWNLNSQFTLSTWLKTSSVSNQEVFSNFSSTNPYPGFGMQLWGGYLKLHISSDSAAGATQDNSGITFNDGQWHLATIVFDNGNIKFYKNGKILSSQTTGVASAGNPNHTLSIGRDCNTTPGRYFNGQIDDVKIYNYALSDDEAHTLYNQSAAAVMGSASTATSTTGAVIPDNSANRKYCVPGSNDYCAPPVGEWKFDEGAGTSVYDSSGAGNNGTMYNMATSTNGGWNATGKKGWALDFDGTDDYARTAANNAYDAYQTGTISYWFKTSMTAESTVVAYSSLGTVNSFIYWMHNDTGKLTQVWKSSDGAWPTVTGSTDVRDGVWHFASFVADGANKIKIYLDGKEETTVFDNDSGVGTQSDFIADVNIIGSFNHFTEIGAMHRSGSDWGYFDGQLDDVRIYNYARTPSQIAWDHNKGAPIAHWGFDECQTGVIHDESGLNHGQLYLGTSGVTATGTCASSSNSFWYNGQSGKVNSSGSFDGTDDYVDMGDLDLLDNLSQVTICAWVKHDTLTGDDIIFSNHNADDGILLFRDDVGATYGRVDMYKFQIHESASALFLEGSDNTSVANIWTHVCGILRGPDDIELWVNGEEDVNTAVTAEGVSSTGSNSNNLHIGNSVYATSKEFDGQIDEVKVWNYALTTEQIKMEYSGGAVRFGE